MSAFLLRRSLTVFAIVLAVLFVVSLLKGRGVEGGLQFAAFWALASTAVFVGVQGYRARRGATCEVCEDLPAERDAAEHV